MRRRPSIPNHKPTRPKLCATRKPKSTTGADRRLPRVAFGVRDHPFGAEPQHAAEARVRIERRARNRERLGNPMSTIWRPCVVKRNASRPPSKTGPTLAAKSKAGPMATPMLSETSSLSRPAEMPPPRASAGSLGERVRALRRGGKRGRGAGAWLQHGPHPPRSAEASAVFGSAVGLALGAVQLGLDDVDDLVRPRRRDRGRRSAARAIRPRRRRPNKRRRAARTSRLRSRPRVRPARRAPRTGRSKGGGQRCGDVAALGVGRQREKPRRTADNEEHKPALSIAFLGQPAKPPPRAPVCQKAPVNRRKLRWSSARVAWFERLTYQVTDSQLGGAATATHLNGDGPIVRT